MNSPEPSASNILTREQMLTLLLAVERRETLKLRVATAVEKADRHVRDAFIDAGLDPAIHYTLNEHTLTATEMP